MPTCEQRRRDMVERQIAGRGITDPHVLAAMGEVPREAFVPAELAGSAYDDSPLPIGAGQTISQPYVVALMTQAAGVGPGDTVLEIGAGSGYAAAILSRIAGRVHAIERHQELADGARERLARLGYDNVTIRCGDGSHGWPEEAPFDAILVAAGSPAIPQPLCAQLAIGGRLVVPVGGADRQSLLCVTRTGEDSWDEHDLGGVRFVPLIGAHGRSEDGSRAASNHQPARAKSLPEMVAEAAEPLPEIDDEGFAAGFDRFADRKVVLLGEASHGTHEFYAARAAITRRFVEKHGFTIVAAEAD